MWLDNKVSKPAGNASPKVNLNGLAKNCCFFYLIHYYHPFE